MRKRATRGRAVRETARTLEMEERERRLRRPGPSEIRVHRGGWRFAKQDEVLFAFEGGCRVDISLKEPLKGITKLAQAVVAGDISAQVLVDGVMARHDIELVKRSKRMRYAVNGRRQGAGSEG